jgi:hypothetical protein
MKTSIKYKDCNDTLCFPPKRICFHEFHRMSSISIYAGSNWLDCGCVMCILKAASSVGPNLVTGKGIIYIQYFNDQYSYPFNL